MFRAVVWPRGLIGRAFGPQLQFALPGRIQGPAKSRQDCCQERDLLKEISRMTGLRLMLCCWFCCAMPSVAWSDEGRDEPGSGGGATQGEEGSREREMAVPSNSSTNSRSSLEVPTGTVPGIESLLRLPQDFVTNSPRAVAGATEIEWRRRFRVASSAVSEARSTLAETKLELDDVAVGGSANQWSVAPPGGAGDSSAATSPLSFRLRQRLRGDRERIDSTEKAYRELRIEADLAGVPEGWRSQPE